MDSSTLPNDTFDLPVDPAHNDAEAALAALRAAIGHPDQDFTTAVEADAEASTPVPGLSISQQSTLDRAMAALTQLSSSNQTILDNINIAGMLQGLTASIDLILKSEKRQAEIVRTLHAQLVTSASVPSLDSASLATTHVPRAEYDDLKARYDALLVSRGVVASQRKAKPRPSTVLNDIDPSLTQVEDSSRQGSEGPGTSTRKKRSMKLEHLVHQVANRRIGVEYNVQKFETTGETELPDPTSMPPSREENPYNIEEFRPDFRGDVNDASVKPYLDQVIEDVEEQWEAGVKQGEPPADRKKITEAVHVYWTRLSKRYEEQLARDRGEVHRDELVRRRQNQYRRQQSHLARRVAAFNASPLNVCKLRALYRTLLVIDFVPPTNERPDPKRRYTEEEWYAYQKVASGGKETTTHETVDQFWFSPSVRSLLATLDVFGLDQATKTKRKGRPKQPAPTFHVPFELWDQETLPVIRPKDESGLPVSGAAGAILFRFHVDDDVQAKFPEWASGLYDNPPIPDEDVLLPGLTDVMSAMVYSYLIPKVKALRASERPTLLSAAEVKEITERPYVVDGDEEPTPEVPEPVIDINTDFMNKNLESLFGVTGNVFSLSSPFNSFAQIDPALTTNSPGTSLNARKQSKRLASELPGGAATPVAKRRREVGVNGGDIDVKDVGHDLLGDSSFLGAL